MAKDKVMDFKKIVAQYCSVKAEDMTDEMRFREDLGLSSLDFVSFLGELEDAFDVEQDPEEMKDVHTIGDAMKMLEDAAA